MSGGSWFQVAIMYRFRENRKKPFFWDAKGDQNVVKVNLVIP